MPRSETVKADGLDYGLFERVQEARDWIEAKWPAGARLRVVGDDDPDGTTSVFCLTRALERRGYQVEGHLMRVHSEDDVHQALAEGYDGHVIMDAGSGMIRAIDEHTTPTLILDHHRVEDYEPKHCFEVNPRRLGGDDVDHCSASIVTQLFALALDSENRDTAFATAAGGIADRQHLSGIRGLLDYVIEQAVEAGHVQRRAGLTIPGRTLAEAIETSLDPYFDGLTGDADATREYLEGIGIDPAADPTGLPEDAARRLADDLTRRLEGKGLVTDRIFPLYDESLPIIRPQGLQSVFAVTRLLESVTAEDEFDMALGLLAGNPTDIDACWDLHVQRAGRLVKELARMKGHVQEYGTFRVAETRDGTDTGLYAHVLLTYVYGDDRPFVVYHQTRKKVKFSARGSPRLYKAGYDLSIGMNEAGVGLGGNGGGHPGASGAAVHPDRLDEFLETLDASLARLTQGE